jgi:hypothetical protein
VKSLHLLRFRENGERVRATCDHYVALPTFCRHNRLIQNCTICSREQSVEARPVVSSSAPRSSLPRPSSPSSTRTHGKSPSGSSGGMRVRRLARGAEDGYRTPLATGLRSSADAERLAIELAFAATRLALLETAPPGLYAEIADPAGDIEERTWLAFQVAYLCPLDTDEPFAGIEQARCTWASGGSPRLDGGPTGPRTAHDPARGTKTFEAYRAWAERAGSQAAAFGGEQRWTPERRFARAYERLALPGLQRDARIDLLVTLGRLGTHPVIAGALQFGGDNEATVAAKRAFGIGDTLLLERRAAELAQACGLPLDTLDLGLHNWGRGGQRATMGLGAGAEPDAAAVEPIRDALGL